MADSTLATRLQATAAQDEIEIQPALRLLMFATADLINTLDRSIATHNKEQSETNLEVAMVKAQGLATQKEMDGYKNRAIGFAAAVGLLSGAAGAAVVTAISKIIAP